MHASQPRLERVLPKVLVLGAGMSGLVTARILKDSGFPVRVIEARRRLGGRIWTDTSLGVPCDLGASWIHGVRKNPLTLWCQSLGIEMRKIPRGSVHFWRSGEHHHLPYMLLKGRKGFLRAALTFLHARVPSFNPKNPAKSPTDISIEEMLAPLVSDPKLGKENRSLIWWFLGLVEAINGAPAHEISIREWDIMEYLQANAVPIGGFERLIEDAAKGLDIELDTSVKRVIYGDRGVKIITSKGIFSGDIAVVTFPLGVIRSKAVVFEPSLDPAKQRAIDRIGYGGVLNKAVLLFKKRFWPHGHERLTSLPESPQSRAVFNYWADFSRSVGAPLLVGFASGKAAEDLDQSASDQEIYERAIFSLKNLFSQSTQTPEGLLLTRWLSDPWSRGSYSYGAPGNSKKDREELARPVGDRLYFTGEATHQEHYGTVHGALLSAQREAIRIHRRYCCNNYTLRNLPWM